MIKAKRAREKREVLRRLVGGVAGGAKGTGRGMGGGTGGKGGWGAGLKETVAVGDKALDGLDASKLSEKLNVFGRSMTRAAVETETTGDWADHYSQTAIYLRLNGLLPPTAKK